MNRKRLLFYRILGSVLLSTLLTGCYYSEYRLGERQIRDGRILGNWMKVSDTEDKYSVSAYRVTSTPAGYEVLDLVSGQKFAREGQIFTL
ncbi:MAG: hypothetical protein AAF135_07410 [Bacteroidota bacterium]